MTHKSKGDILEQCTGIQMNKNKVVIKILQGSVTSEILVFRIDVVFVFIYFSFYLVTNVVYSVYKRRNTQVT